MFKVLEPHCTPKRGTKYSAYVDLFSREDVVIGAGETKVIKLGVKIDLENLRLQIVGKFLSPYYGYTNEEIDNIFDDFMSANYIEVALRSSLAVKGLIIANGIGIIDLDYPDEIGLILHNPVAGSSYDGCQTDFIGINDDFLFRISKGDKVAQCTLKEHKGYLMGYESDVIREGGYGSTGN